MKEMKQYIAHCANVSVSELASKPWTEVVHEVILPRLAGLPGARWRINDRFMKFVAHHAQEVVTEDFRIGVNLLEIAMQRLSNGAVLHEGTSWPQPLDKEFWEYSSKGDEPGLMTEGCYQFVISGLPVCLQYVETREHALKILFGLVSHLNSDGTIEGGYMLPTEFEKEAAFLYGFGQSQVEKNASFEELFDQYAKPEQWQKHKIWLAKNSGQISWKNFFQKIQAKGWLNKRRIKKEILLFA